MKEKLKLRLVFNIIRNCYVQFEDVFEHSPGEYVRLAGGDTLQQYVNKDGLVKSERQRKKKDREREFRSYDWRFHETENRG